jgi:hypothetical protein
MELSYEQKLDLLLDYYKLAYNRKTQYNPTEWHQLAVNTSGGNNTYFRLLIEDIHKSGYVDSMSNKITPKGLSFEGFVKEKQNKELQKEIAKSNTGHQTNIITIGDNHKGDIKLDQNQNFGSGKQVVGKNKSFIEQVYDKLKTLFTAGGK